MIVTFIPGGGDLLRDSPSGAQFKARSRKEHHPEDLVVFLGEMINSFKVGHSIGIVFNQSGLYKNTNLRNPAMDSLAIFSGLCSYE